MKDCKEMNKKFKYILFGALIGFILGFVVGIMNYLCNGELCLVLVLIPPILGSISYYFTDYFTLLTNELPFHLSLIFYSFMFSLPYLLTGGLTGYIINNLTNKKLKK